jgi:hypothetical protein
MADQAKVQAVLEEMRKGKSLRASCVAVGVPNSTFLLWVSQDEAMAEQYARARDSMIDAIADDTMTIADEMPLMHPQTGAIDSAAVAHQRLRVDTRRWLLSKLAPKRYGDRIEVAGDPDAPIVTAIHRVVISPTRKGPHEEDQDS